MKRRRHGDDVTRPEQDVKRVRLQSVPRLGRCRAVGSFAETVEHYGMPVCGVLAGARWLTDTRSALLNVVARTRSAMVDLTQILTSRHRCRGYGMVPSSLLSAMVELSRDGRVGRRCLRLRKGAPFLLRRHAPTRAGRSSRHQEGVLRHGVADYVFPRHTVESNALLFPLVQSQKRALTISSTVHEVQGEVLTGGRTRRRPPGRIECQGRDVSW